MTKSEESALHMLKFVQGITDIGTAVIKLNNAIEKVDMPVKHILNAHEIERNKRLSAARKYADKEVGGGGRPTKRWVEAYNTFLQFPPETDLLLDDSNPKPPSSGLLRSLTFQEAMRASLRPVKVRPVPPPTKL